MKLSKRYSYFTINLSFNRVSLTRIHLSQVTSQYEKNLLYLYTYKYFQPLPAVIKTGTQKNSQKMFSLTFNIEIIFLQLFRFPMNSVGKIPLNHLFFFFILLIFWFYNAYLYLPFYIFTNYGQYIFACINPNIILLYSQDLGQYIVNVGKIIGNNLKIKCVRVCVTLVILHAQEVKLFFQLLICRNFVCKTLQDLK